MTPTTPSSDSATGRCDEYAWRTGAVDFGDLYAEDERAAYQFSAVVSDVKRQWELNRARSIGRSWEPVMRCPMTPAQRSDAFWSGVFLLLTILTIAGLSWLGYASINQAEKAGNAIASYGAQGWEGHK